MRLVDFGFDFCSIRIQIPCLMQVPPYESMNVPLSEPMVSEVLKDSANYSTMYIGKWHLGETNTSVPQARGFDEQLSILKGASLYLKRDDPRVVTALLGDFMDDFLYYNLGFFVKRNNDTRFHPNEYMTDYLGHEAAKAILSKTKPPAGESDVSRAPYFLTVSFNAPHTPLQALKTDYDSPEVSLIKDHKTRVYAAMILALDRAVGYVLDAVKESGQANDTMIIFTSDNGGPGYVGIPTINAPLRGWKASFFEGGIRVPMFISWPAVLRAGTSYRPPVSHVDIFATIVSAGGGSMDDLNKARLYDGKDLIPFVQAMEEILDMEVSPEKTEFYIDNIEHPHRKLFWRSGEYMAMRAHGWKFQVNVRPDKVWMYDVHNDPSETKNRAEGISWSLLNHITRIDPLKCVQELRRCVEYQDTKCVPAWPPAMTPSNSSKPSTFKRIVQFMSSDHARTYDGAASKVKGHERRLLAAGYKPVPAKLPTELPEDDHFYMTICVMGFEVKQMNSKMVKPMWPALAEIPISIDKPSAYVSELEEEMVYWAN